MSQVEAHTLVQFSAHGQNFLGEPRVILPALQMSAEGVGMPFFEMTDINKMNIFRDLPHFPGPFQVGTIAGIR